MKTAMTISDVIRASDAHAAKRELSLDELGAVRGGDNDPTVPFDSPYYPEYSAGQSTAESGSNTFWTGFGAMMGSLALPPPADVGGAVAAGGVMVNGADQMDRGEAMMDHAQAQYEASLPPTDGAGGASGMGGGDGGYHGAGGYGGGGGDDPGGDY